MKDFEKIIEQIRKIIPEIIHYVVFYSGGIIFQSSYNEEDNIPEIGHTLVKTIEQINTLYRLCIDNDEPYRRIIFETAHYLLIILPLGEDSDVAFILNNTHQEFRIQPIEKYLEIIEDIVDHSDEENIENKEENLL